MGALLELLGFRPAEKQPDSSKEEAHEITQDQIKYANELADERRRAWASASHKS
jgi:hypothetical protein